MGDLPVIPLEELFEEIPYPDRYKTPLRYWSVKTTMEYLGVSMRQVRRYLKAGKLKCQYKLVKGRKRVFISNHSVIALRPTLNNYKEKYVEAPEYDEEEMDEQEATEDILGALLGLAECLLGK